MDDIKVLLLKSGQHIITKLSELTADSGESLCFVFEVPLIIRFVSGTSEQDTVISFSPDLRITIDTLILFSFNLFINILL